MNEQEREERKKKERAENSRKVTGTVCAEIILSVALRRDVTPARARVSRSMYLHKTDVLMVADNFVGQPTAGERALKPHFRKIRVKNGEFAGEPRMTAEIMEGETAMCATKMLVNISDACALARSRSFGRSPCASTPLQRSD